MFVKVTKNREGTQYVSIVEGYRDKDKVKHRTIKSLGKLKDLETGNPNYLTELKEDVKAGKYQPEPETLSLTLDLKKKISNPLQNYGWCKCQCQNVFFLESQNVQLLEFNVQKI